MPDLFAQLRTYDFVDLSIMIDERLPCYWPPHGAYRHIPFNWYEEVEHAGGGLVFDRLGPYYTATLQMDEHTGTHIDAPSHLIPPSASGLAHASESGDINVEHIPLDQLIGRARVIDVSELTGTGNVGVSPRIGIEKLEAHERVHGRIKPDEIVLIRSGWDRFIVEGPEGRKYVAAPLAGDSLAWPAPHEGFITALVERGVRTLGTDGPSMGASDDGACAHYVGLGAGMVFIEAMGNLSALPEVGATVMFLGLRIRGGSGAPGRAIAFVPKG